MKRQIYYSLFLIIAISTISVRSAKAQTQLIQNGGFESAWTGWTHSGGVTVGSGSFAHIGSGFLWLGGDNGTDTAYQEITIPSTASAATLSFYYNINSSETSSSTYDTFSATINDSSFNLLATVENLSNLNGTPPGNPYYYQVTYNLLPYAGKSIYIYFASNCHLSGNKTTNFRVDDVSVLVTMATTGSLQVTISPGGAISAGAQWRVDGGTLQSSGATVSGLSVGSHTVSFSTVSGWTTPGNQSVSVSANSTAIQPRIWKGTCNAYEKPMKARPYALPLSF